MIEFGIITEVIMTRPILALYLLLLAFSSLSQAETMFHDSHGNSTSLSALKGKWVIINYWASWCHSCIEEVPELNRFYQNHKKDPLVLFGVNYDALPPMDQQRIIRRLDMRYPNLLEDPATILNLGDITGVPVTFIFNPKGKLVKTLYGGQTMKGLEEELVL